MRNHEERLEEVQKRIAQVQYKQKQRRSYMMAVSSVAVCLVVIVGLASVMPGVAQNIIVSDYDTFKTHLRQQPVSLPKVQCLDTF